MAEVRPRPDERRPTRTSALPNLFVIGASKSGSSALHTYLSAHPDIAMSREKEPCFFVDRSELAEAWPIMARQPCSHDLDAYLALWPDGADKRYRGEGSVYYSQAPHKSGVPERIARMCPDARIIYTVREPVWRAIGHYWQRFKEFQEPLPLDRAVRENALYRDTSDYALQLAAYRDHFDPARIHVIVAEDLRTRRRETLADLIAWLGLPPHLFRDDEITDRHVSPPDSRRQRFPLVARLRDSGLWARTRRHLPERAVGLLREGATVRFDKAEVDDSAARDWLSGYLRPRRAAFEEMIGRRIPEWD
ncbi:sulfotransferase family protein [Wenxinia marina]|uniref:Sulfotransferase family n=1 Tax=Wenxinia marina DSM 24838 TaxID=1123501 RepID=A0A0D0NHH0_9RHOB|nr:sulfotransferase [Wenxinia marina]KIQ67765.1 Sulfotransferase family [Wenxinia marina DSM 24838]GGL77417.1 hypothetical protein GCM10011392_34810 [Wenxinia marina]